MLLGWYFFGNCGYLDCIDIITGVWSHLIHIFLKGQCTCRAGEVTQQHMAHDGVGSIGSTEIYIVPRYAHVVQGIACRKKGLPATQG